MPAGVGAFHRPQREGTHEAGDEEHGEERIAAAVQSLLLMRLQQLHEAYSRPYDQRGRAERLVEDHACASLRLGPVVIAHRQWGFRILARPVGDHQARGRRRISIREFVVCESGVT